MNRFSSSLLLGAACLLASNYSLPDQNGISLTIEVVGGKPNTGNVILSVFSSEENFLKHPVANQTSAVDEMGTSSFTVTDLLPGRYAVSAVYDEDGNGELNTGLLGIPKEMIGFSNNAKGVFGPPKFEKAAFEINSAMTLTIPLGAAK